MMGKRAEFSIVTFLLPIQIAGAELGFVLVRMIELFHTVVSLVTIVLIGAILMAVNVPALFRLI